MRIIGVDNKREDERAAFVHACNNAPTIENTSQLYGLNAIEPCTHPHQALWSE